MPRVYNDRPKRNLMVMLQRAADPNPIHSFIMHSMLFSFSRITLLALISLVPLAHLVDGGPLNSDLWDLGATSYPDANVALSADLWSTDSSTDADPFPWPGSSDSTSEYDDDHLLAAKPSCHADADLTQFEPYSKLRARESCPAGNPAPPLALPTLEKLGDPEEGSGSIGVGDLNRIFNVFPQTDTQQNEEADATCPSDRTFGSKVPVCDSGKMSDANSLAGFPYSTLYNIQFCWSHQIAFASQACLTDDAEREHRFFRGMPLSGDLVVLFDRDSRGTSFSPE